MKVTKTKLEGCFILEPSVFEDNRGFFFEFFNKNTFKEITGLDIDFVQDNFSKSKYGTIRGIHFQKGEFAQAKLVTCVEGKTLNVAVDLRENSATFGQYISVELSPENKKQLFVPRGFGHGFSVLVDNSRTFYKCDNFWNKQSESGIIYNDPTINIDWKISESDVILSEKDKILPNFLDIFTK